MTEAPLLDLRAKLYFDSVPTFAYAPIAAAWADEGKECENLTEGRQDKWSLMAMRGPTLVALGLPAAVEQAPLELVAQQAAIEFDFSQTYIVDPQAALADLRQSRVEISLLFRIEEPSDRQICFNELACAILGIDRVTPLSALWLEGPQLAVGRRDLSEFLSLQDTRDGSRPQATTSLMFSTQLTQHGARVRGRTAGLDFFGHRELTVDAATAADAARLLYNAGAYVTTGGRYAAGETMSSGPLFARIADDGEALALQL